MEVDCSEGVTTDLTDGYWETFDLVSGTVVTAMAGAGYRSGQIIAAEVFLREGLANARAARKQQLLEERGIPVEVLRGMRAQGAESGRRANEVETEVEQQARQEVEIDVLWDVVPEVAEVRIRNNHPASNHQAERVERRIRDAQLDLEEETLGERSSVGDVSTMTSVSGTERGVYRMATQIAQAGGELNWRSDEGGTVFTARFQKA